MHFPCVCVCARECIHTCEHACGHLLPKVNTYESQSWLNAPRQKKQQKPQFLHQPELAGCVVWCLLDHNQPPTTLHTPPLLPLFPLDNYSKRMPIIPPSCWLKTKSPLDKTTAVYERDLHKTMTDMNMCLVTVQLPWTQTIASPEIILCIVQKTEFLWQIKVASADRIFSFSATIFTVFLNAPFGGEKKVCTFLRNVGWTSDHPAQVPSGVSQPRPCQR